MCVLNRNSAGVGFSAKNLSLSLFSSVILSRLWLFEISAIQPGALFQLHFLSNKATFNPHILLSNSTPPIFIWSNPKWFTHVLKHSLIPISCPQNSLCWTWDKNCHVWQYECSINIRTQKGLTRRRLDAYVQRTQGSCSVVSNLNYKAALVPYCPRQSAFLTTSKPVWVCRKISGTCMSFWAEWG